MLSTAATFFNPNPTELMIVMGVVVIVVGIVAMMVRGR